MDLHETSVALLCLSVDLHQSPVCRPGKSKLLQSSVLPNKTSLHNPTTPRNIICNTLNRLEGGDPALPRTQSGISAFIIRESQLYLSFPAHKTRRKLRFAQSKFRCLPPLPLLETKIAPPALCFHFFCFHFFASTFLLPLFNWVSDRVCSLRFNVHLNGGEERDAREFWSWWCSISYGNGGERPRRLHSITDHQQWNFQSNFLMLVIHIIYIRARMALNWHVVPSDWVAGLVVMEGRPLSLRFSGRLKPHPNLISRSSKRPPRPCPTINIMLIIYILRNIVQKGTGAISI